MFVQSAQQAIKHLTIILLVTSLETGRQMSYRLLVLPASTYIFKTHVSYMCLFQRRTTIMCLTTAGHTEILKIPIQKLLDFVAN